MPHAIAKATTKVTSSNSLIENRNMAGLLCGPVYSAEHFFCACGYNRGMRFSLRTLLIAIGAVPLLIGVVVWTLWPERGSPRTIGEFQQALKSGSRSGIESATYYCFVEGARRQSATSPCWTKHSWCIVVMASLTLQGRQLSTNSQAECHP